MRWAKYIARPRTWRPAESLEDAAVKLRRLGAYVEDARPMRLLTGALEAVERAAEVA